VAGGASVSDFESSLATFFEAFVALKRACGAGYVSQAGLLRQFDAFLHARKVRRVTGSVIDGFVRNCERLTQRARDNTFGVAWDALQHARRHGARVDPLPQRPSYPRAPKHRPYVLTDAELDQVLRAAKELPTRSHARIRRPTFATLLGLLCTTGLRIGEAVALDLCDIDFERRTLLVRAGKFNKSRLIPLTLSTIEALRRYLTARRRLGFAPATNGPLFVSSSRERLSINSAEVAFRKIVEIARVRDAEGRRPRLHDLRHTFAVRTVTRWHRRRRNASVLLALLSTYLGHVGIQSTQYYLQPNDGLLQAAGRRFETACAPRTRSRRDA
jgi:integrase/recombinase XerD